MDSVPYDFDREQDLLFPIGAVISSAHHYANSQGFGLWGMGETVSLIWTSEIGNILGIVPQATAVSAQDSALNRVLFEPIDPMPQNTYWETLFAKGCPKLVVEYNSDTDKRKFVPTHDSWLVWPWQMSVEDRHAALLQALEAHKAIEKGISWPDAVQRSVVDDRSALFGALQAYVIGRSKKRVLQ